MGLYNEEKNDSEAAKTSSVANTINDNPQPQSSTNPETTDKIEAGKAIFNKKRNLGSPTDSMKNKAAKRNNNEKTCKECTSMVTVEYDENLRNDLYYCESCTITCVKCSTDLCDGWHDMP